MKHRLGIVMAFCVIAAMSTIGLQSCITSTDGNGNAVSQIDLVRLSDLLRDGREAYALLVDFGIVDRDEDELMREDRIDAITNLIIERILAGENILPREVAIAYTEMLQTSPP